MATAIISRRVLAGSAIVNSEFETGMLGLRVLGSGKEYAMTCGHVVAPRPAKATTAEPITSEGRPLGPVVTWSPFGPGYNTTDAALIDPGFGTVVSNEKLNLGPAPGYVEDISAFLATPGQDMKVEIHSSRVSAGPILGEIDDVYIESDNKKFGFDSTGKNEFFFAPILGYHAGVDVGDSGSAVVHTQSRKVLGIHFAVDEPNGTGYGMGYCILFPYILAAFQDYQLTISP